MAINNLNTGVGISPTIVDAKGDLIVATGADAVNRLAVGTANQQLVVDSSTSTGLKWAAPAGLVLLNTTSFSGVASQSVNDVFSATYDRYRIMVYTTPTTNIGISFNFRVSGADNTTANYRYGSFNTDGLGADSTLYNQVGDTKFNICQGFADPVAYSIDIHNPFGAFKTIYNGTYFMHKTGSEYFQTGYTGGSFNDTTSFTGFTIGGGTQTGTVSVYGYNK